MIGIGTLPHQLRLPERPSPALDAVELRPACTSDLRRGYAEYRMERRIPPSFLERGLLGPRQAHLGGRQLHFQLRHCKGES